MCIYTEKSKLDLSFCNCLHILRDGQRTHEFFLNIFTAKLNGTAQETLPTKEIMTNDPFEMA